MHRLDRLIGVDETTNQAQEIKEKRGSCMGGEQDRRGKLFWEKKDKNLEEEVRDEYGRRILKKKVMTSG